MGRVSIRGTYSEGELEAWGHRIGVDIIQGK